MTRHDLIEWLLLLVVYVAGMLEGMKPPRR